MNLMIVNDGSPTTAQVATTLAAITYADRKEIPNLLVLTNSSLLRAVSHYSGLARTKRIKPISPKTSRLGSLL
jgi:hypothetical protein